MSENKVPASPAGLSEEQAEAVGGGGECTVSEVVSGTGQLVTAYENVVEFVSHVIGRVAK